MADKRITDLQLRDDFDDDCNLPVDDTIQTYRTTGAQVYEYVSTKNGMVDFWNDERAYSANDWTIYNGVLYKSLQGTNLNNTPASSASYWQGFLGPLNPGLVNNHGLTVTADNTNHEMTVALKNSGGSDPSPASPVLIPFRNATITNGSFSVIARMAALSVVIPNGATLGHRGNDNFYVYVYALNNAGSPELAVSSSMQDDTKLVTTTALSSSADSFTTLYSTNARTDVPIVYLGCWLAPQATSGQWDSNPTEVSTKFKHIRSGTYSPTISNTSGVDSTPTVTNSVFYWQQIGNIVNVWGQLSVDPSSANSEVTFRISLPVPAFFSGTHQASGLCIGGRSGNQGSGNILAVASAGGVVARMHQPASGLANETAVNFTYVVTSVAP